MHQRILHLGRDERGMSLVFVSVAFMAALSATTLAIDVGMFLGAPVLRVFVGSAPSPDKAKEAFERGVEALRKTAEIGAEAGMPVALQNHSGLTSTGDDMLAFYKAVNHPNFTLLLDTGHFAGRNIEHFQESIAFYQQTVQGAFREVSDNLIARQRTREFRQKQEERTQANRDATEIANTRYEGGMGIDATVPYGYEADFMRPQYPVGKVKLEDFFSQEQIENVRGRMKGWTELLARMGY